MASRLSGSRLKTVTHVHLLPPDSEPRYADTRPEPASVPDVEDDDSDPNYARISNFRQPPSPQSLVSRTPSPAAPGPHLPPASPEELDGLYAKVNKARPPAAAAAQSQQHHAAADR